ncbi:MAG TPA: hypothetical protein VFK21_12465 [Gammaproteobacteria bacterium]|nr:hypothetical protein [Gammaproteobacteria bacterium]
MIDTKVGFLVVAAAVLAGCASAPPTYDQAMANYKAARFQTAFRQFSVLADAGDANAQLQLAYMYEFGQDVVPDARQAVYWFERSASQGNVMAELDLGYIYLNGPIGFRNSHEALSWYQAAAGHGSFDAQVFLANAYWHGYYDAPKDHEQADKFFAQAAAHAVGTQDEMGNAMRSIVDARKDVPPEAIKANMQGKVTATFDCIDQKAQNIHVTVSSGYPLLDQALVTAIQESVFPAWAPGAEGLTHYSISEVFTIVK